MHVATGSLVCALNSREITAAEFADAVHFLPPEAANLAISMLSTVWDPDPDTDGRRRDARLLCRESIRPVLSRN
jgi:hypothetical protein